VTVGGQAVIATEPLITGSSKSHFPIRRYLRGHDLHRDSLRRRSAGSLQQCDTLDVLSHPKGAYEDERERDPLPTTAFIRQNWSLTCAFAARDLASRQH
jgi:hypothetical protein